ncbi:MAG: hypothetical protein ACXWV2_09670 [Chitinophagaceae bacterium]
MKKLLLLALAYGMFASAFAQPGISKKNKTEVFDKWEITPVTNMKGVLGMLDINFPKDVERNILIYQLPDNKFLRSVSHNDKTYPIAPGEYRFTLTNVPIDNVPIKKGHETRLRAGYVNLVSEGDWHLYDESKEKAFTSGNKPVKLVLPVGSYQLKLGGQFFPMIIKDSVTVEY